MLSIGEGMHGCLIKIVVVTGFQYGRQGRGGGSGSGHDMMGWSASKRCAGWMIFDEAGSGVDSK